MLCMTHQHRYAATLRVRQLVHGCHMSHNRKAGPHLSLVERALRIGAHDRHGVLGGVRGAGEAVIEVVRRRVCGVLQLLGGIVPRVLERVHDAAGLAVRFVSPDTDRPGKCLLTRTAAPQCLGVHHPKHQFGSTNPPRPTRTDVRALEYEELAAEVIDAGLAWHSVTS